MRWVGIVGTRTPSETTRNVAVWAARAAVARGFGVVSGGAAGVDEAALEAAGRHGWAILPWPRFRGRAWMGPVTVYDPRKHPAWEASVDRLHPAPGRLSAADRRLLARDFGIAEVSAGLIAFPRLDRKGGTWQAVRAARALGRPVLVLTDPVGDERGARRAVDRFLTDLVGQAREAAAGRGSPL